MRILRTALAYGAFDTGSSAVRFHSSSSPARWRLRSCLAMTGRAGCVDQLAEVVARHLSLAVRDLGSKQSTVSPLEMPCRDDGAIYRPQGVVSSNNPARVRGSIASQLGSPLGTTTDSVHAGEPRLTSLAACWSSSKGGTRSSYPLAECPSRFGSWDHPARDVFGLGVTPD